MRGFIGNVHLKSFQSIDKAEVVAVCDIIEERAREAAEEYKVPRVYTDFSKVIEDKEVDAVIIGTPPHLHKEQSIEALKAGKHVFLEKPMATCLKDAIEIRNRVKKTGQKLMLRISAIVSLTIVPLVPFTRINRCFMPRDLHTSTIFSEPFSTTVVSQHHIAFPLSST
ncbi:MAG: hypothetical protein DRJ52_08900 [Thermoprotei archaeon]|nr:MAG: hypothetical protein DRJ52_08900 [Thermoprotei archaeon]